MVQAVTCPQCGGPLSSHRFARSIVCPFCGAAVRLDEASVSAAKFHKSFRIWNSPETYGLKEWVSLGDRHWALDHCIARGDISDVYTGRRARWPTELVIVKLLRDRTNAGRLDDEWNALQALQTSDARGADVFSRLIPQPVLHGNITGGPFTGRQVSIFRWASGFHHTFTEVIKAFPGGIPPRASIWVWRRILEVLSFIHASGMAHGAIVPAHLLVQDNEHGVRLVGYSLAGRLGEKLRTPPHGSEAFYPQPIRSWSTLTRQLDLVMSARCVVAILGGHPENGQLPAAVPARLASTIQRMAHARPGDLATVDAWTLREELGQIADEVFGAPQFIPIVMPG